MDDLARKRLPVFLFLAFTFLYFGAFLVAQVVQTHQNHGGLGLSDTRILSGPEARNFYRRGRADLNISNGPIAVKAGEGGNHR